jgi:hypothetical protein
MGPPDWQDPAVTKAVPARFGVPRLGLLGGKQRLLAERRIGEELGLASFAHSRTARDSEGG